MKPVISAPPAEPGGVHVTVACLGEDETADGWPGALGTAGVVPAVIVKFASDVSKKMPGLARTMIRACVVAMLAIVTLWLPSFGVPEDSVTG
jgi:hypothetical protein